MKNQRKKNTIVKGTFVDNWIKWGTGLIDAKKTLEGTTPTTIRMIKYFKPKEFACKHCGDIIPMSLSLVEALDWLRGEFGIPFVVTSGYRCKTHNTAVNGAKNSFHMQGKAADITVARKDLLQVIYRVGIVSGKFNGVGLEENRFIHFDTGNRAQPYYFVYLPEGGYKQLNPDILVEIKIKSVPEYLQEYKV